MAQEGARHPLNFYSFTPRPESLPQGQAGTKIRDRFIVIEIAATAGTTNTHNQLVVDEPALRNGVRARLNTKEPSSTP